MGMRGGSHSGQFPASSPRIRLSPQAPRRPSGCLLVPPMYPRVTAKLCRERGPRSGRAPAAGVYAVEEKKDTVYWEKRRKNNEALKRSREKRRLNDAALEARWCPARGERLLRAELRALKHRFGLPPATGEPGPRLLCYGIPLAWGTQSQG